MTDLTQRQLEIFRLIYESARDRGYQPTVREIGKAFGIRSPNGIHCHTKALVRLGYLRRLNGSGTHANRAWVILRRPDGSPFTGFEDKGYVDNLYDSRTEKHNEHSPGIAPPHPEKTLDAMECQESQAR